MAPLPGQCPESRWRPECGHIPRGFLGATGTLEDVRVVMVLAEPGKPQHFEQYDSSLDPKGMLKSAVRFVYGCYEKKPDKVHCNVRWFLDRLYPELTFDEQLRHVWITETRLCSIKTPGEWVPARYYELCEEEYLAKQLELLSHAAVIAFGTQKAQPTVKRIVKRLRLDVTPIEAHALAPRDLNAARDSWERALRAISTLHAIAGKGLSGLCQSTRCNRTGGSIGERRSNL